jgi:GNAT superfamily N-acetyltransferase
VERFRIEFNETSSRAAGRYVVRGFFTPREIPQAVVRAFLTRELYVFIGLPLLVVIGAYFIPDAWELSWRIPPRQTLFAVVMAWLMANAIYLATLGKSEGIAVMDSDGRLVGGLRLKVSKRRRVVWMAGILVDPSLRGKGMFPALLLAVFQLASDAAKAGPLTLEVFAPAHPASKRVVEKYFGGKTTIPVESAAESTFAKSHAMLDAEVRELESRGVAYDYVIDRALL